jgi:hypothetical protein
MGKFRRSAGVEPWMLVVTAVVVLLGVGLMFYVTVHEVDERVDSVRSQIDRNFKQLQTDVRRELDARLPPGGTVPTAPTPEPTADPFAPTETPTPEATVTPEPTTTPDASAPPSGDEPQIIQP